MYDSFSFSSRKQGRDATVKVCVYKETFGVCWHYVVVYRTTHPLCTQDARIQGAREQRGMRARKIIALLSGIHFRGSDRAQYLGEVIKTRARVFRERGIIE